MGYVFLSYSRADAFVVALLPAFVRSDHVRREFAMAESARKRMVSVVLRETHIPPDLEYTLGELQRIKLTPGLASGVTRLVQALQQWASIDAGPRAIDGEHGISRVRRECTVFTRVVLS